MKTVRIRVLIVDDHAILRAGLRLLLEAQDDIIVVGEASDGTEAAAQARQLTPDVVLLDISMPGPSSSEVIRNILRGAPKAKLLVLTMHDDAAYLAATMLAGACGFIAKKMSDIELMVAIRAVNGGRTFVNMTHPAGSRDGPWPMGSSRTESPRGLSGREQEVLRLLAEGNSNQQIAKQMNVSVKTVEAHRTRLSEKLGLKGRSELYRFAVESGVLDLQR